MTNDTAHELYVFWTYAAYLAVIATVIALAAWAIHRERDEPVRARAPTPLMF